jgi:hypothetical protein
MSRGNRRFLLTNFLAQVQGVTLALVRSILLQSALKRTIGRERLERRDDALNRRLLENLGATDLNEKNSKKK